MLLFGSRIIGIFPALALFYIKFKPNYRVRTKVGFFMSQYLTQIQLVGSYKTVMPAIRYLYHKSTLHQRYHQSADPSIITTSLPTLFNVKVSLMLKSSRRKLI